MRSPKTNMPAGNDDGGGSKEVTRAARGAGRKQPRPGTGARDKQNPKAQRNRKIEAWCQGKAERYS